MSISASTAAKRIATFLLMGLSAILPEFIPEEWKEGLKAALGSHYSTIWTATFSILSLAILILTWNQSQDGNREYSYNSLKISGRKNKVRQGTDSTPSVNTADITGDDNTVQQG